MTISTAEFARRSFRDHPRFHFGGIDEWLFADVAALVVESGFGEVIGWYRDDENQEESWMIVLERGFIVPLRGKPTTVDYADLLHATVVEGKRDARTLRMTTTKGTVDAVLSGQRGRFRDVYEVWRFIRYLIPSRVPPTIADLS